MEQEQQREERHGIGQQQNIVFFSSILQKYVRKRTLCGLCGSQQDKNNTIVAHHVAKKPESLQKTNRQASL